MDDAGGSPAQTLKFLDAIDAEAQASKRELERGWEENLRQVRGDQWRLRRAPYFFANVIRNQSRRKVAALTESKFQFHVRSTQRDRDHTAHVLYEVERAIFDRSSTEELIHRLAQAAFAMGSGFLSAEWNPEVEDVEVQFWDPRQVAFDRSVRSADALDKAQWVRTVTVLPIWEIRRRFPGYGQLVKPDDRLSAMFQPTLHRGPARVAAVASVMPYPYRPGTATRAGAVPMAEVRRYFINDPQLNESGDRLYPGGREVIRAGPILLVDRKNEYWDGRQPLEMFVWDPDLDSAWGLDEVGDLRRIQEAILRLGDAWVRNAILGSNFKVIADVDALDQDQWKELDNEAGLIVKKRPQREFRYEKPTEAGDIIPNVITGFMKLCDYLTGNVEDGGRQRSPGEAAAPFEGLQVSRLALVRDVSRRLESMLERLGQKLISRIYQYYTCLTPDTECLTKRGWKSYDQLCPDDELYGVNLQTGDGEWSPLLGINVHSYDGLLYTLDCARLSFMVTPNHTWPMAKVHRKWRQGNWKNGDRYKRVEMCEAHSGHVLPNGAPIARDDSSYPDAFVEFVGWVVTEGSYIRKNGELRGIEISQSLTKNPEKCKAIEWCLERLGIPHKIYRLPNGCQLYRMIHAKAREIIRQFPDKRLTSEFLVGLSRAQVELLIQTMIAGDGTVFAHGSRQFFSADPHVVDQFQMLCVLAGIGTTSRELPRGGFGASGRHRSTRYGVVRRVSLRAQCGISFAYYKKRGKLTQVPYRGVVWCPTTTIGTWIARRNGRVYVTGNSDRILLQHGPSREWIAYTFKRQELLTDDQGHPVDPADRQTLWRDFRFVVTPGSALATTRVSRTMAALQLRSATGVAPSIRRILQEADLGDPDALIQEGLEELQKLPPPPPPKGRGGRK